MPTLYFSYSLPGGSLDTEEPLSSPYTISWNVGQFLRQKAADIGYAFHYQNLDDTTPCTFEPDDICIGHCWWDGGFMDLALSSVAKHKFILQPYSAAMVSSGDVGMVLDLWKRANHLFLVTGEYWWQTMEDSPYAELKARATRLDMSVNCEKMPYLKTRWNKPGERAVCVIGNDTPTKGYANVAELARIAGFRLGHFGNAKPETFEHVPCMTLHGGYTFTPDVIAAVCDQYDALVCLPLADANPTVLLEAAAWGLKVFCNVEGGYLPAQPFNELRLNDMRFNIEQMRDFQEMDAYTLAGDSLRLRTIIERDYTWTRFCNTVWAKVSEYL